MEAWSTLEQALMITLIGVGLVFAVLFVMWGLMAALVRVTTPRTAAEAPAPEDTAAATAGDAAISAARRRAALVGVAVALAIEAERAIAPPLSPAQGAISPWQATIRGNALSRRAGAFRRNPPQ